MTDFNDSLDRLFAGDIGPIGYEPVRAVPAYKTAIERFEEGCIKCKDTGKFITYSGRVLGDCFACKGAGKKTFKTSSDTRAANREQTAMRKQRVAQQGIDAFAAANPAEFAWLEKTAPRWDVAASLLEGARKYGSLTDKQMTLVRNGIARDAARAADAPSIDSAGIDRLKASFDAAIAYSAAKGLKLSPRITIDGMTISPAKAHSANPGALYVKASGEYMGKIKDGQFFAYGINCTKAIQDKIQTFIADPQQAAKVYGQTTGTCCICNATLISKWKHRGIGPICAEKFGWD